MAAACRGHSCPSKPGIPPGSRPASVLLTCPSWLSLGAERSSCQCSHGKYFRHLCIHLITNVTVHVLSLFSSPHRTGSLTLTMWGLQGLHHGGRGQSVPASGRPGELQVFPRQPPASSSQLLLSPFLPHVPQAPQDRKRPVADTRPSWHAGRTPLHNPQKVRNLAGHHCATRSL